MRRAILLVVLALATAGCSDADEDRGSPAPHTRVSPRAPLLLDQDVGSGAFTLGPDAPRAAAELTIPQGAVQVVIRANLTSGVVSQLQITLGTCALDVAGPAPATGQTVGKDCGALAAGPTDIAVENAGPLTLAYEVVAKVCMGASGEPTTGCPTPP